MNFKQLNEAFDRLNEKALNEGPGAGYNFYGTAIIKVDNVKVLSKEDDKYDTIYEVSFNGNGTADIDFTSYYYGGSLKGVPVVATKAYIDVENGVINNGDNVEQYIESLFYNEKLQIDLIYGGGFSHLAYDGTVASEEHPAENTYSGIMVTDMKITDKDIIQYIDDVVLGTYENDDYFEKSLSEDRISGNLNLSEENKSKEYNPPSRPAFPGRELASVLQNAIADAVQDYYDTTGVIPTSQEVRDAIEPFIQSLIPYEISESFKRISRYGVKSTKNTKLKEDVFYNWKPNTSFAHIKKIYNDVKKRGYKYVNNELEEMHAAMKKVDARGYTPEQRKQIRSWSEEIWRANRKNESLKESYDDVNSSNAFDVLYDMVELFGCEEMLNALAKAMGTSDLADNLTYICRQYDYDPSPDSVNESLTEEESEDARKFIRKFCSGQWSDDYVNLIIYAMGEVVMADYREDIEDACSEILKANSKNAWVVIEEKLSASDLFKYCYEEFYDDLSTICNNILNGQSVDRTISSYFSTGYNRDKFVQVVRDIISRIDFEDDFDLAEEIDSALIYDEDLWSVIEFYLDPDDIINGNGFDTYISFVNDVEDIMLEYYSTGDKNESLNEEESPKSISDNGNSYPLAFVPTTDVKGKDLTNTLCDVLNKAGIKYCCAKKRGGKYHITVICPSGKLATAKTVIENCGFFKEWFPLNNRGKNESLTEERGNYGHKGPFWYYSKHGMGPGTIPKDVKVVDWYEDDDYNTWVALDSVLTTQELREYELKEQKPPIKDR